MQSVELSIKLQSFDGQLAGSLADEYGQQHSFTCYLGLLTLLEEARQRALASAPVAHRV